MDSSLLLSIHKISALLFLISYSIKTILLFSNRSMLDKYTVVTKVPEMIISFAFLVTGVWLFVIIGGIKIFQIVKLICVFASIPIAIVGFKRHKKGLALLSLLLIITAYGLAEMSRAMPFMPAKAIVTTNNSDPMFAEGARVYHSNCAFCHGSDGKKMYRNAPDLTMSHSDEAVIVQMVTEGSKGKMPAYKIILTDAEIAAVAKFVIGIRSTSDGTQAAAPIQ
jgi:mono/diheme cytochrome c family protein